MTNPNPFTAEQAAALYARGRPDHHPRSVQHLAALLPAAPVGSALDVGCGTGLSAAALGAIADRVVGVDAVAAMAAVAGRTGGDTVAVAVATAECLPVRAATFDLVTVASAVHWFDQDAFFGEARRVLTGAGVVAVTEHFFLGEMDDRPDFGAWVRAAYVTRYPTPPRGRHLSTSDEVPPGLELIGRDAWDDPIEMSQAQLVDYFLTQSNTIAVVESGREERDDVRRWLTDELAPFFGSSASRTLRFWGSAVCYRPTLPDGV